MAERLTGWDKAHAYILRCFGEHEGGNGRECPHMGTDKCNLCRHMIAVVDKLARLEDKGDG